MFGVSLARCVVVVVPASTNIRRAQSKGYLQEGPLGSKLELAGGAIPPPVSGPAKSPKIECRAGPN